MTPILAPSSGNAQQCLDYILRRNHGEYTQWDIQHKILYVYFHYSASIDPVMLVAQMIHETGNLTSWWSARPRRNPAGIGVTGRIASRHINPAGKWAIHPDGYKHEGNSYLDWTNGIWCHIGRVLCYRFKRSGGTAQQRWLMDEAHRDRPFPLAFQGRHHTWEDLNGRWAVPGTTYAQSIARIAEEIRG